MDIHIYIYSILCVVVAANSQYGYYHNQIRAYDHYNDMSSMENSYDDYDYKYDSSECPCSCKRCEDIKPCCRNVCSNCIQQQQPSSIVIVPYPYPFIISTKQKDTTTQPPTTVQTTTELSPSTTVTTQQSIDTTQAPPSTNTTFEFPETSTELHVRSNDGYFNELIAKSPRMDEKNKFVLTSLRRTKSNWMPKYGIVPIPDNLAEKLMLQLRSMRVLHPQKETFSPQETLNPSLEKL